MKKVLFFVMAILCIGSVFGDEFFRSKFEFEGKVTYEYVILTDKGEWIEVSFNSNYAYQDIYVFKYTVANNKITVHEFIGKDDITFELERSGKNLIIKSTGKLYEKVADIKLQ
ncbi:hypothetical protein AGMMS49944_16300 [Spirochaetia bacterium]|nr:hypothetical protein AGMMS49944_16300 [Spirochaetia bacterium]